jgi:hypothetical protein
MAMAWETVLRRKLIVLCTWVQLQRYMESVCRLKVCLDSLNSLELAIDTCRMEWGL